MAVDPTHEQVRKLHVLLAAHEENPRFISRRAIDKSCVEVVEVTDPSCVPAAGYPVVERFALDESGRSFARLRSRSWVIQEMVKVLNNG